MGGCPNKPRRYRPNFFSVGNLSGLSAATQGKWHAMVNPICSIGLERRRCERDCSGLARRKARSHDQLVMREDFKYMDDVDPDKGQAHGDRDRNEHPTKGTRGRFCDALPEMLPGGPRRHAYDFLF
jgi:hypothetical protein